MRAILAIFFGLSVAFGQVAVRGLLVDSAGAPLTEHNLNLKRVNGTSPQQTANVKTDGQGRFSFSAASHTS